MKHIAESLTIGLAVLIASAAAPRAADWAVGSGGAVSFGSVKDYQNAAVPVPAPTPSLTYEKDWYLRADIGYDLATSVSVSDPSASYSSDLNGFTFGSVGFGRYITPSLRGEISFDFRPHKTVSNVSAPATGSRTYVGAGGSVLVPQTTGAPVATAIPTYDVLTYTGTETDKSYTSNQSAMVNLYYDIHTRSRFTPYIGAGVGIDFNRFSRSLSGVAKCTSAVSLGAGPYSGLYGTNGVADYPTGYCPSTGPATVYLSQNSSTNTIAFAAALMLGTTYDISETVKFDAGYRLMWEGAELSMNSPSISGTSTVKISDRLDHEIRTGVRIDLN